MRIEWIDRWRGLLIICIALFHCSLMAMIYVAEDSQTRVFLFLKSFIATFHVSSFFAVAGLLWSGRKSIRTFVGDRAKRLLVPYIVWGAVFMVVYFAAPLVLQHGATGSGYYSELGYARSLSEPFLDFLLARSGKVIGPLWFLPSLFIAEVSYCFVDKAFKGKWYCAMVCACCFGLNCFLEPLYWHGGGGVPAIIAYLPKYVYCISLGRMIIPKSEPEPGPRRWLLAVMGVVMLFVAWAEPFWEHTMYYRLAWFGSMTMGVFGFAMVARVVSFGWLSNVGRASLGILVMHKFVILAFQVLGPVRRFCFGHGLPLALSTVLMLTCFAVALPCLATKWLRRYAPWAIGEVRR